MGSKASILTAAEQRFDNGYYVYGNNSTPHNYDGATVTTSNGVTGVGIDCSNLVSQSLEAAGYPVPQLATSAIFNQQGSLTSQGSQYYSPVSPQDVQQGDLVMFSGHIGIVASYDPNTGVGTFFGSQSSTGPGLAQFTTAAGTLTFALHQRLPYKRLLIITGVMLLFVLVVSVGEEVNEMQLAHWIGTTPVSGLNMPGWMGTWFSLFNNWETFIGQAIALLIVLGSYVVAQYLRVWRPRRRGQQVAKRAFDAPERPADIAVGGPLTGAPV